jgi:hypothetical protein
MISALCKSRTFVSAWAMLMLLTPLIAEAKATWGELIGTFPVGVQRDLELAERLESYNYDKSALHYLKKIYRTSTDLNTEQLEQLNSHIESLEAKISLATPQHALPDLEVMLHFDAPAKVNNSDTDLDKVSLVDAKALRPDNFPSTRIDKKKWIIRGLIAVGVGVVAYKVHEHLNKEDPPQPNTVVIEF